MKVGTGLLATHKCHLDNTTSPTFTVSRAVTEQSGCRPRITAFDRTITVNGPTTCHCSRLTRPTALLFFYFSPSCCFCRSTFFRRKQCQNVSRYHFSFRPCGHFLARLYESTGRAIAVTTASVSPSTSASALALLKMLNFLG